MSSYSFILNDLYFGQNDLQIWVFKSYPKMWKMFYGFRVAESQSWPKYQKSSIDFEWENISNLQKYTSLKIYLLLQFYSEWAVLWSEWSTDMSLQKLSKDVKNVRRFMSSGAPKLMKKFKILHWIIMGQNSPLSKCLSLTSQIWHPEHLQKRTKFGTKCQPVKQFNNYTKLQKPNKKLRDSALWSIIPNQKVKW